MLPLLAAFAAAAQPAPPSPAPRIGRTAWIFSTIDYSEWCPSGNVTVEPGSGRYSLTRRAPHRICNQVGLERPRRRGRLAGRRLADLRAAYLRALSESLQSQACREGRRPQDMIIVNNAGPLILVVASGWGSMSAPDDLACWSEAANALRVALEGAFPPDQRR